MINSIIHGSRTLSFFLWFRKERRRIKKTRCYVLPTKASIFLFPHNVNHLNKNKKQSVKFRKDSSDRKDYTNCSSFSCSPLFWLTTLQHIVAQYQSSLAKLYVTNTTLRIYNVLAGILSGWHIQHTTYLNLKKTAFYVRL